MEEPEPKGRAERGLVAHIDLTAQADGNAN